MGTRIIQIALRIALLEEEFTENEIREAVKILEEKGSSSVLLDYLCHRKILQAAPKEPKQRKRVDAPHFLPESIKKEDPEKYGILSNLYSLFKSGKVMTEIGNLRRLGQSISKTFPNTGSKREIEIQFIGALASLPINDIKLIIQDVLSSSKLRESEYQQLADFIISGTTKSDSTTIVLDDLDIEEKSYLQSLADFDQSELE